MAPTIRVDPLSKAVLRVVPKFNEVSLASATAFVVVWQAKTYLITNWHVVSGRDADSAECLDKKHAAIPNLLSVHFHEQGRLGSRREILVPLVDGEGSPLWLEHPMGRTVDVVAVPVPSLPTIQPYALDLSLANADMVTQPGQPVFVIGYPFGLVAGEQWPIWKTGHIASDPDIDFSTGRPAFLIDATTREGMSGAPVVLRLNRYETSDASVIDSSFKTKLLGVYAGRIHNSSEVGRVWRAFLITELFLGRLLFDDLSKRARPTRMSQCPCGRGKRFKECCGRLSDV